MFTLDEKWNADFVEKFGGIKSMQQQFPKIYTSYQNTLDSLKNGSYDPSALDEKDIISYLFYDPDNKKLYAAGRVSFSGITQEVQGLATLNISTEDGKPIGTVTKHYCTKKCCRFELGIAVDLENYRGQTLVADLSTNTGSDKLLYGGKATYQIATTTLLNKNIEDIILSHPKKNGGTTKREKISFVYHCGLAYGISEKLYDYDFKNATHLLPKNPNGLFLEIEGTAIFGVGPDASNPKKFELVAAELSECVVGEDSERESSVTVDYEEDLEFYPCDGGFEWRLSRKIPEGETTDYYQAIQWNERIPKEFFNSASNIGLVFSVDVIYKDENKKKYTEELVIKSGTDKSSSNKQVPWFYFYSGCFAVGTRIHMADGSKKSVEQLMPDDMVLGCLGKKRKVVGVYEGTLSQPFYSLKVQDHDIPLQVSEVHLVQTERGLLPAYLLTLDDLIENGEGRFSRIESLAVSTCDKYYHVDLENDGTSPANSLLLAENLITADVNAQSDYEPQTRSSEWEQFAIFLAKK